MAKGNGIRETAPGKFVASMYDKRVKGGTRHLGTFTAPPQPNPKYRTRKLAEKAARDEKERQEKLRDLELKGGSESIESFAKRWTRDYTDRRGPSTLTHYEERIQAFVRDFGDRPLWDGVSVIEARAWIFGGIVPRELNDTASEWDGAKTRGKDVEVPEHTGHHTVVRTLFNDAVRSNLAPSNPFSSMNVPEKPGRRGDAITILTPGELADLIATAHDVLGEYGQHIGALIEAAAWTGLRPGEMWALEIEPRPKSNRLDFKAGEVHVDWQINRGQRTVRPKWNSMRIVYLLPPAASAFHRAIADRTSGPLFHTRRGLPMNNSRFGHYWEMARTAFWTGLPPERKSKLRADEGGPEPGKIAVDFDFYELRHHYGTRLAEMGMHPAAIAKQMGHKDGGQLAMKRYIHMGDDAVKRDLQERFAAYDRRRAAG